MEKYTPAHSPFGSMLMYSAGWNQGKTPEWLNILALAPLGKGSFDFSYQTIASLQKVTVASDTSPSYWPILTTASRNESASST